MAQYCLIGEKLGHSFSKIIHEKMGYQYDLVEVPKDDLQKFVSDKKYKAYNVTIPYKQVIMPMLDHIDESALLIGSVNTVINRNGELYGYNTDIFGMEYAFKKANIDINNKKVLILGSGGTCATALALSKKLEAKEVIKVSRNGENNYENMSNHYDAEIIINTTPVGMYPNNENQLLSLKPFYKLAGVFDAIYNPLKTNLLLEADDILGKDNCHCDGLSMLVAQAKYARDIFFDQKTDDSMIDIIVNEIKKEKLNYVLIGMPSCGKSSIGTALAKVENKEFFDTDSEIYKISETTIPEIFKNKGEQYFRKLESSVIQNLSKKQGLTIATGGGAILNQDNIKALKQNGLIIFIDRDVKYLISDGRPLSKDKVAIQKLYNDRIDLYRKSADVIVDGNGSIEEVLALICKTI